MPSFDIVSKPDWHEIDNALDQAQREISQRFDFKDTDTTLDKSTDGINIAGNTDDRVTAALDVLKDKMVRRKVSLKFLDVGEIQPGPKGSARMLVKIKDGIPVEKAREIVKDIKDQKLKVQPSIQQDTVRVSGKKRDDLQACIQHLRSKDFDLELQFINFRD